MDRQMNRYTDAGDHNIPAHCSAGGVNNTQKLSITFMPCCNLPQDMAQVLSELSWGKGQVG
jgi:hypothetical protein